MLARQIMQTLDSCSSKEESPSPPSRRAWSLVIQSHAAKKALETSIRTEAIEERVRFQGPG
jgi:hypothetical protein